MDGGGDVAVNDAEIALVASCAAGSADAFEELRGRYHGAVHAALRDSGARQDIEDLEQEVWARLLSRDRAALRDFRGGSLRAFLAAVARSVCLDHGRKARSAEPLEEAHGVAHEESTLERLAARQEPSRLARALDQVARSARDRDVLRLRYEEGMPVAEIAALGLGGLSARGVESLLRRASSRLRGLLGPDEP